MMFPNAIAAGDGAALLQRQAIAFVVAANHVEEQPSPHWEPQPTTAHAKSAVVVAATSSYMPCGGSDYPPCYVAERESHNTYDAYNPTGCGGNSCYGRWQFSGAWAGKLGLPMDLSTATPAQQDAAARELWAGGAGCSNWSACP